MKSLYAACHVFIASVFWGVWCYLLLAVIPDSWVAMMAPISLGLLFLACVNLRSFDNLAIINGRQRARLVPLHARR